MRYGQEKLTGSIVLQAVHPHFEQHSIRRQNTRCLLRPLDKIQAVPVKVLRKAQVPRFFVVFKPVQI